MSDARRGLLGATFREGGAAYDALRPSYPVEAVARGVGPAPRDVLDVGAGTGKLTGVLLSLGHRVTAVDPSVDMLERLRAAYPQVRAHEGTGEATGLADSSVDVVTYGAAWHWVDPERASQEAARVLRPGGRLVLLWNLMDLTVPWVASLNDVMHSMDPDRGDRMETADLVSRALFEPGEHLEVRWLMPTTTRGLAGQVTTRSYYLALDAGGREELARRVEEHVRAALGSVDDTPVEVPHLADVHRFDLR